jgi:DNA-binding NtrC family response regulator
VRSAGKEQVRTIESNQGARILLIDDVPLILQALQRQLEDEFEIDAASSAEEGLEAMKKGHFYSVVMVDMMMPGMGGIEFLDEARRLDPIAVLIMLTGDTDHERAMQLIESGKLFHFLSKPCRRDSLLKTLHVAIEVHALQKRITGLRAGLQRAA